MNTDTLNREILDAIYTQKRRDYQNDLIPFLPQANEGGKKEREKLINRLDKAYHILLNCHAATRPGKSFWVGQVQSETSPTRFERIVSRTRDQVGAPNELTCTCKDFLYQAPAVLYSYKSPDPYHNRPAVVAQKYCKHILAYLLLRECEKAQTPAELPPALEALLQVVERQGSEGISPAAVGEELGIPTPNPLIYKARITQAQFDSLTEGEKTAWAMQDKARIVDELEIELQAQRDRDRQRADEQRRQARMRGKGGVYGTPTRTSQAPNNEKVKLLSLDANDVLF